MRGQQGAVLAISLIVLLVLTIVVISSNQSVILQEKMSQSVRDSHVSLSLAEAGVRAAEVFIDGVANTTGFVAAGTDGLYSTGNGPVDFFNTAIWTPALTDEEAVTLPNGGTENVQFFIEHLGELTDTTASASDLNLLNYGQTSGSGKRDLFKIVSRACGAVTCLAGGTTERIVVTYYARSF